VVVTPNETVNFTSLMILKSPLLSTSHSKIYTLTTVPQGGPGSSIGIVATGYGLDGPGIESRWGRDFSHKSRPVLGPTQPPVQWVPGLSPGVKRPGRGTEHPTPPSAEVENE
jgi:hypothetical protein